MADVFISYKRQERARVEAIARGLQALGLSVWFDASLEGGGSFSAQINREVRAAKCVLVCWTPAAAHSEWVIGEAEIGRTRGVLAPAFLAATDLPPPFNTLHAFDLMSWNGDQSAPEWLALLDRIGSLVGRAGLRHVALAVAAGEPVRAEGENAAFEKTERAARKRASISALQRLPRWIATLVAALVATALIYCCVAIYRNGELTVVLPAAVASGALGAFGRPVRRPSNVVGALAAILAGLLSVIVTIIALIIGMSVYDWGFITHVILFGNWPGLAVFAALVFAFLAGALLPRHTPHGPRISGVRASVLCALGAIIVFTVMARAEFTTSYWNIPYSRMLPSIVLLAFASVLGSTTLQAKWAAILSGSLAAFFILILALWSLRDMLNFSLWVHELIELRSLDIAYACVSAGLAFCLGMGAAAMVSRFYPKV
jgi:hypothetical protein